MHKNILILGLGAFGFAVAKHLGENNSEQKFFASEVNPDTFQAIQNRRQHPYFFPGKTLPSNIELVENAELNRILPTIDIIISVIPCQFLGSSFEKIKDSLKEKVILLNLSKGIQNETLTVPSETLKHVLSGKTYSYVYLAGGMIAEELVEKKVLGADVVSQDEPAGKLIKNLFEGQNLHIRLKVGSPKNTELAAALKNIVALILGYYEGQGAGASTLGYYFSTLLQEIILLTKLLSPTLSSQDREQIDFSDYALSGDLIATCFGNSRNRLLGNMLGKGVPIEEALAEMKAQKKIAEGYETLKGVQKIIAEKEGFEEIKKFCEKFL